MAALQLEPQLLGKLVALEGDPETIDTQLRLLPPSQKILILPALPDAICQSSDNNTFNAPTFVRDVHTAFMARGNTARAFLRSSTSTQPRLVVQNGGSVGARATCISKIANLTDGDIGAAETIFNEIVKDGVAGLMKQDVGEIGKEKVIGNDPNLKFPETIEDPRARAMKAADSLDRETEGLQSDDTQDSAVSGLESIVDSPAMGSSHSSLNSPVAARQSGVSILRKDVYTSHRGDGFVRTVLTVPVRGRRLTVEEKRTTFGHQYSISTPPTASTMGPIQSPDEIDECDCDEDLDFASAGEDSMFSIPTTPAVYEEAFLVDVQSTRKRKSLRKTQSMDRFLTKNSKLLSPPLKLLKYTTSECNLKGLNILDQHDDDYQTLPRTTFVKASHTTIRKSPTLGTSIGSSSSSTRGTPRRVFLDRGEDAFRKSVEKPFAPVFPVVEDLIVHLIDDNTNAVLESVISSYKDGSYPIIPTSASSSNSLEQDDDQAVSISNERQEKVLRPESYLTTETDDPGLERRQDYDPYNNSYPPDMKRQWPSVQNTTHVESLDSSVGPPTPTLTPPLVPEINEIAEKFVDLVPANSNNAINVQNSLRQLLSQHFPAGENGYSQYYYSVAAEADRLWKPVFRNDHSTSIGNDGRNVDQIIALGCEDGVKKDFFFQISGQVERLGSKRDGANRSGKLDIRYLISNVMQHFCGFSSGSAFNPLSNPQVLAALLVPQIEAYLAINTGTRLLILQYPAYHLPTIFALRNLLGSDLFKVAGILDSLASDPPSITRSRTSSRLSNEAVNQRSQPHSRLNSLQRARADSTQRNHSSLREQTALASATSSFLNSKSPTPASFAKADFLLPSTATDAEISTFLSGIWKCLMEKSTFYTPEPEPKPIIVERPPIPSQPASTGSSRDIRRETQEKEREKHRERDVEKDTDQNSNYPSSYRYNNIGSQTKISRLTGSTVIIPPGPRSNYSPSITSTSTARPSTRYSTRHRDRDRDIDYDPSITSTKHTHTHKYAASIASAKTTVSEKERRRDKEWENFYIGDEDSEDDAFDRMIMGRSGQMIVAEPESRVREVKRDKRKALKWLGLA